MVIKVTLEEKLVNVSDKAQLWETMDSSLSSLFARSGHASARLSRREAIAFIAAGERSGYGEQDLVLEYWRRVNKTYIIDSLREAVDELNSEKRTLDMHKGYDLQHAIYQHLGWMKEAKITVPEKILEDLTVPASVLALHAKANYFHAYELLPVLEMFEGRIDENLLIDARVAGAKTRLKRTVSHFEVEDVFKIADSLNTLQKYGHEGIAKTEGMYFLRKFLPDNRLLSNLVSRWDLSEFADEAYITAIAAFTRPNVQANEILDGYVLLSGSVPITPVASRVLTSVLDRVFPSEPDVFQAYNMSRIRETGSQVRQEEAALFIKGIIANEITQNPDPAHIENLFELYTSFEGRIDNSDLEFRDGVINFLQKGLINSDIATIATLAERMGISPEERLSMYSDISKEIAAVVENAFRFRLDHPNRDIIGQRKNTLSDYAARLAALARVSNDRTFVHQAISTTVEPMFGAEFGFGIHYLCSLILHYNRELGEVPREQVHAAINEGKLKSFFSRERTKILHANIGRSGQQEILSLYDNVHRLLYGTAVAEEPRPGKIEGRAAERYFIVYVGSKKLDGTDYDTVEVERLNLEERLKALEINGTELVEGTVPGKGKFYGIKMNDKQFKTAMLQNFMPPAHTVYVNGSVSPINGFVITKDNTGSYVQTYPVPNTFAIHHLNTLANSFGRETSERKTAPHHRAYRR